MRAHGCRVVLQRVPSGVCAVVTPWNVPLMMTVAMVTPALVTGNTGVLKPARVNSLLAVRFTETGKETMRVAAQTAGKPVMELGGNNPVIACEDADVVKAPTWWVQRHFGNTAPNCSTSGRYYVHESVYERFVAAFVGQVEQTVVVDVTDDMTIPREEIFGSWRC